MATVSVSVAELEKVLRPDSADVETFVFGINPDGSPRSWKLTPLRWKYEREFRKQVMPMFSHSYKPFETMVVAMSQQMYSDITPSIVESISASEVAIDEYLTNAVQVILLSQDKTLPKEWADDNAESREQLLVIIQKQCALHKIMDNLGESLAERFQKLAEMLGFQIDLVSLRRVWKQVSARFSERITKLSSTVLSVIGPSTENLSETLMKNLSPQLEKGE